MLVMAIAATIFLMGLRQYHSYRMDADVQQFYYEIDQLFQAMSRYFIANCAPKVNLSTTPPTLLNGLFKTAYDNQTAPYPQFPIDISKDLIAKGYLAVAPSVGHPFVKSYIVQFNDYGPQPKMVCTDPKDCANNQKQVGIIFTWKIQVAVLMRDPTDIDTYKVILNADCVSDATGKNAVMVTPCSSSANKGNYLVFERTIAMASPNTESGFEAMTPSLKQFQQMYSTYPITNLTGSTTSSYQYYNNCGI